MLLLEDSYQASSATTSVSSPQTSRMLCTFQSIVSVSLRRGFFAPKPRPLHHSTGHRSRRNLQVRQLFILSILFFASSSAVSFFLRLFCHEAFLSLIRGPVSQKIFVTSLHLVSFFCLLWSTVLANFGGLQLVNPIFNPVFCFQPFNQAEIWLA